MMEVKHLLYVTVSTGILYGLCNMLIPISGQGFPHLPFPFYPSKVIWFGTEYHHLLIYPDALTAAVHNPDWLIWSVTLMLQ
jgi:hypothetical protein